MRLASISEMLHPPMARRENRSALLISDIYLPK